MRNTILLLLLCLAATVGGQTTERLLLSGWRFQRGAAEGAERADYDDQTWQRVTIPHDWAIAGPFDKDIDKQVVAIKENGETQATEKTGRSGSLPWIGEGWYRTTIDLAADAPEAELVFDGAMAEAHAWLDGRDIGSWAYGYNAFRLPVKDLKAGRHTLAVHLRNMEESSRWYPGAGLIRPVRLVLHPSIYIKEWGTQARATRFDGISADHRSAQAVRLTLRGEINQKSDGRARLRWTILDAEGREAARAERQLARNMTEQTATADIRDARLWAPEHPALYTLVTELVIDDKSVDRSTQRIGLRQLSYTQDGFALNGEKRKFRGVCLHHDMGPTGAAFNKDAFRRQVRLLKQIGCDAIRTSHNMPAPWQLDICDEMGMMVMAESFDMWRSAKCRNGYARFFDKTDTESPNADGRPWYLRDIENLVLAGRNHASVVMWSIGNEVHEQGSADGVALARSMQDLIHRLDPERPVTQGMNQGDRAMQSGVWQTMDIPGWNYHVHAYQRGEQNAAGGIIIGSETASTVSSRGVYRFPVVEETQTMYPDGQVTSYDLVKCYWSNLPDDDWMQQDKDPRNIGEFVWTGFDYLGEPTPYDEYWPSRSSYFGIFDLAGLPKDRAALYRTHWLPDSLTLHTLPHWTWPEREGEVTPVYVYTNQPEAELFVNGVSQGRLRHADVTLEAYERDLVNIKTPWGHDRFANPDATPNRLDRYRLRWNDVRYHKGDIRVVAYDKEGRVAAEQTIKTAGRPHHITIEADRASMPATPHDAMGDTDTPSLTYYTVSIVDRDGNLCPDADTQLTFAVEGQSARFRAVCNGDATSTEVFTQPTMKAFHGQLVVVVESTRETGESTLTVSGRGLKKAAAKVVTE